MDFLKKLTRTELHIKSKTDKSLKIPHDQILCFWSFNQKQFDWFVNLKSSKARNYPGWDCRGKSGLGLLT